MSIDYNSRDSSISPERVDTSAILQQKYNSMLSNMKPKIYKGLSQSTLKIKEPQPRMEASLNKYIQLRN